MWVRFFNTYEPVTTFYRDLLPYLAEQGIFSDVMISAAEYRQGSRKTLAEVLADPSIHISYIPALGLQPVSRLQKLMIMLAYIAGSMFKTLFGASVNLNFFLTQPPLFSLWGWVLKKVRHQPYLCLVMDIYPDVAVLDGLLSSQSWLTRILTKLSRFALKRADAIIVIGRCMAERVRTMGLPDEKVHIIPNWVNPEVVYPIAPGENRLRQELGLQDKFVVLYSGNMGVSHEFDDILEVARRCHDESNLHFVFIGGGQRRKQIESFITEHQLQNVTLLPFQPLEKLAESLSLGDVQFISLREGFEGLVVPSKAYGALAAGRAIIYQGNPKGEIARMVEDENIGIVIQNGAVNDLFAAIRAYAEDPLRTITDGQRAFQVYQKAYQAENALISYTTLFKSYQEAQ